MSQWFHFGLNGSVDEIKPRVSEGNPSFMIHKRHLIRKDSSFFRTALPGCGAGGGNGLNYEGVGSDDWYYLWVQRGGLR